MDVFALQGSIEIVINNAIESLKEIESKATDTANKLKPLFTNEEIKINGNKSIISLEKLNSAIKNQQTKLSELRKKHKEVVAAEGENSTSAQKLAREIDNLSSELNTNKQKLSEASKASDKLDNSLDKTKNTATEAESKLIGAFKRIGAAVIASFAVDKIIGFGKTLVEVSSTVSAEQSSFAQIMGSYSSEAQAKMEEVATKTGVVSTRLTGDMTSLTAKFKGLGYGAEEATSLASRGLILASDASAFWDKSLEDAMGGLNSFINGNYEGGEAIGLFANETQMAAYAVEKGLVKNTAEWSKLDEATKQATRLEYAENMMKASGATGQAAKESSSYMNVQANLNEQWRQFLAIVGEPLLQNVVLPAMQALSGFITNTLIPAWYKLVDIVKSAKQTYLEYKTQIDNIITAIGIVVAALLTYNTTIALSNKLAKAGAIAQKVWSTAVALATGKIKLATIAQKALNLAMKLNPVGLIVTAIVGLIAILVVAYKRNENFRKAVNNLWKEIKSRLKPIFEALKPVISSIINLFKSIWNLIKALVIPIFQLFVKRLQAQVAVLKPIISTLLKVFTTVFTGITKVVTPVIKVITKIIDVMTKAVTAVTKGIGKIKGLFNFKWNLPKLKVPKFSISPSGWKVGDLLKGKIPKLSVKWNAEGAIFKKPAIFDTQYGLQGVGEKGAEAIAPIDKLQSYVRTVVREENQGLTDGLERIVSLLSDYLPILIQGQNKKIILDSGVLAGEMTSKIDINLAHLNMLKERGN